MVFGHDIHDSFTVRLSIYWGKVTHLHGHVSFPYMYFITNSETTRGLGEVMMSEKVHDGRRTTVGTQRERLSRSQG